MEKLVEFAPLGVVGVTVVALLWQITRAQRDSLGKSIEAQGASLGKSIEAQGASLNKAIEAQGTYLNKAIEAQGEYSKDRNEDLRDHLSKIVDVHMAADRQIVAGLEKAVEAQGASLSKAIEAQGEYSKDRNEDLRDHLSRIVDVHVAADRQIVAGLEKAIEAQGASLNKAIEAQGASLNKAIQAQGASLGKAIEAQGAYLGKAIEVQGAASEKRDDKQESAIDRLRRDVGRLQGGGAPPDGDQ